MRYHRFHEAFQIWQDPDVLARLVRADALCVARIEPVLRNREGKSILDLVFSRDGEQVVVPLVLADGSSIVMRRADVLGWPIAVRMSVSDDAVAAIDDKLRPVLEDLSFGRTLAKEHVHEFGPCVLNFQRARALGLFGAVPLERVVPLMAPYIYARRFARNRRVAIDAADGALGAAVLRTCTDGVGLAPARDEDDAFARRWYRVDAALPPARERYDLFVSDHHDAGQPSADVHIALDDLSRGRIVDVAQSIPLDLLLSFDPADAPSVRRFAVVVERDVAPARPSPLPSIPESESRSAGNVVLVTRADAFVAPDADTDSVATLERELRAAGLTVDVRTHAGDLRGADLVHLFGLNDPVHAADVLSTAQQLGTPYVVTANFAPGIDEPRWAMNSHFFAAAFPFDDAYADDLTVAFARRKLEIGGHSRTVRPPGYDLGIERLRTLLPRASAVLVSCDAERAYLEQLVGPLKNTRVVEALVARDAEADATATGFDPFVLLHAPIEPRCNALLVARALRDSRIPLVIAGEVADAQYCESVRAVASANTVILTEASPSFVSGLYRRAAIALDASYISYGYGRIARVVASGAAPIVPMGSYAAELFGADAWTIDPLSCDSIRGALASLAGASDAAERVRRCVVHARRAIAPSENFRAVLEAYAAVAVPA